MLGHEGMISVYRGFVPTLLGIMPYASISFFTFETLKQRYRVGCLFCACLLIPARLAALLRWLCNNREEAKLPSKIM